MRIGPDNYRSVMHLSIERLTARGSGEDVIECLTGDYRFLQWRHSFSLDVGFNHRLVECDIEF